MSRDKATEWVDVDGPAVGKRIVQACRTAGITGRELAELLNVSERSVRDYASGETIPWRHFNRLEEIFGQPVEWWLHGRKPRDRAAEQARAEHREVMRALEQLAAAVRDLKVDLNRLAARESRARR